MARSDPAPSSPPGPAPFDRNVEMDLLRRALAAWFRAGHHDQPGNSSRVVEHDGKFYVVLEHWGAVRHTMAVYRVLNSGLLKSLKRPPRAIAPDWHQPAAHQADEADEADEADDEELWPATQTPGEETAAH